MKYEKPPYRESIDLGQLTAQRFSFMDRDTGRWDYTYRENFRSFRAVRYGKATEKSRLILNLAANNGMVLGSKFEGTPGYEQFRIPNSARPINHDRRVKGEDSLTYGDDKLFYDIGKLLRALSEIEPEKPLALSGDISKNIAFVEFTKPDEPKVLLVPGFENYVVEATDPESLLDTYARQIHEEFGDRFMDSAEMFIAGYTEVSK